MSTSRFAILTIALIATCLALPSAAGAVGFYAPKAYYKAGVFPQNDGVLVTDGDDDGHLDVLATGQYDMSVFFKGNSTGTFTATAQFTAGYSFEDSARYRSPEDGKTGQVICGGFNGVMQYLWRDWEDYDGAAWGSGNFSVTDGSIFPIPCKSIYAGDLDGDSLDDIVIPDAQNNRVVILKNKFPDFPSTSTQVISVPTGSGSVAVADFQGDGRKDIVVTSTSTPFTNGDASYTVLTAQPDGSFQASPSVNLGQAASTRLLVYTGRFHGPDSPVDLLFLSDKWAEGIRGRGWILKGNGDGTFEAPSSTEYPPANSFPYQLQNKGKPLLADFDGDGSVDDVADPTDGSVLTGRGDGTFAESGSSVPNSVWANYAPGVTPEIRGGATGDFNLDGKLDMAVAVSSGVIGIYLQDGDAPTTSAPISPADGAIDLGARPTFQWTAADDGDGSIDRYEIWVDGELFSEVPPGVCSAGNCSWTAESDLTVGPHVWQVRAFDPPGNASQSATRALTVDDQPPAAFSLTAPADGASSLISNPQLTWQSSSDSGVGIDRYEIWIDGSKLAELAPAACAEGACATTAEPISVGSHSWQVRAVDLLGNTRNSSTRTFSVAPETSISSSPPATTVKTGASFTIGSNWPTSNFECSFDDEDWVPCASPISYLSLSDGAHSFEVRASATPGGTDQTPARREWTVNTQTEPVAELSVNPNKVLTGDGVGLNASSSDTPLDGSIVTYEWDLDGNGTFETDGGGSSTTSTQLNSVGISSLGVRVTNDSGNSASKYTSVDVRRKPLPGAGLVGVSINDAAIYTNDRVVKLKISWPAFATDLAVSNDGGFATSSSFPLPESGFIEWTLNSSGPERLPKQVYVRYYGIGGDTITYSDDVILDESPPVISEASIVGGPVSASSRTAILGGLLAHKPASKTVRLRAFDKTSGVAFLQTAVRKNKPSKKVRFKSTFRVKGQAPRFIRVQDRAGNFSKWRTLKQKKRSNRR